MHTGLQKKGGPWENGSESQARPTLVSATLKLACFTAIGLVGSQENGFWMELFDDHVRGWALVLEVLNL
jgi:hypothetical protein